MTMPIAVIWVLFCIPMLVFPVLGIDDSVRLQYSLIAQIIAPAAAALCCYIASIVFPKEDAMRKVWGFLGAGVLCWGLGAVLFAAYPLFYEGQETPYPWYSDIGYLALAPFVLTAFFIFKQNLHIEAPLWGYICAMIVFLGALALSVIFNLNKFNELDSLAPYAVTLLYTVADPLLLGGTVIVASILAGGAVARPWWLVLIGLVFYYLADLSYTYLIVQEQYATGDVIDTGWLVGFGCIAVAALMTHSMFKEL